jgi:hypothetical protein
VRLYSTRKWNLKPNSFKMSSAAHRYCYEYWPPKRIQFSCVVAHRRGVETSSQVVNCRTPLSELIQHFELRSINDVNG